MLGVTPQGKTGVVFFTVPESYLRLRDEFTWELPEMFNLGISCSDRQHPDGTAVVDLGRPGRPRREATYDQLRIWSNRMAHALAAAGLFRGDRAAVDLPQSIEAVVAYLAVAKAGGITVPVDRELAPGPLAEAVIDADIRIAITDADREDTVREAAPDAFVVVVDGPRDEFWEFVDAGSELEPEMLTHRDDPALLFYPAPDLLPARLPSGVLHAHRAVLGSMPGFDCAFDLTAETRPVSWTPGPWSRPDTLIGFVLPTLHRGGTLVVTEMSADGLADAGVTAAYLPADELLPALRARDRRGLGAITTAATATDESLEFDDLTRAQDTLGLFPNAVSSVAEAVFFAGESQRWPDDLNTYGRAYPGHDLTIVDDRGRPTDAGEDGTMTLAADDPSVFLEYWNRPAETAERFVDGRFITDEITRFNDIGALEREAGFDW